MKLTSIASSTLLLAACALIPQTASAFGNYPNQIPNGNDNRCANCHISPGGGGARNDFGQDVEANGPGVQWDLLFDLDSDGDGQTNGEELGDPCGDWTGGAAPRTTDISLPGDDADVSADPNTPACLPVENDAGPAEPEDDAGDPEPEGEPEDGGVPAEPGADAGAEPAAEPDGEPEGGEPDPAVCACTSAPDASGSMAGFAVLALAGLVTLRRRRR